ncbi:MAG: radical SAM protein [Nanobdellota archaeon]
MKNKLTINSVNECNNKCTHCNLSKKNKLSLSCIKKKLKDYSPMYDTVVFTKGEITIRNDVLKIVNYAKKYYQDIEIVTNGRMLYYSEFAKKLIDTGVSKFIINIPFIDEISYNKHTKSKGFRQLIKGFYNCLKNSVNLACEVPITKSNLYEIHKIVNFLRKNKINEIILNYSTEDKLLESIPNISVASQTIENLIGEDTKIKGLPLCYLNINERLLKKIVKKGNTDYIKTVNCPKCKLNKICPGIESSYAIKNGLEEIKPNESELDILLVNPKFHKYDIVIEPLSLEYISSYIQEKGYKTKIYEMNQSNHNNEEIFKIIKKRAPRLVAFSCFTLQVNNAYELGKKIKKKNPHIKIAYGGMHQPFVYGGMHTTTYPKEPFIKGEADYVIIGEGERPYFELLDAIDKNKDIDKQSIKGLCYKKQGQIKINSKRNHIENLDEIPFPSRNLVEIQKYSNDIHILPYAREKAISIIASRGCKGTCSYCVSPEFYMQKMRFRSPENVLKEVKQVKRQYEISNIHFHDDNFVIDKRFLENFCNLMIQSNLNIKWICLGCVESLYANKELIPLMRKAGCVGIEIGIETGSEIVLKKMNKTQDIGNVIKLDKILKENNIIPMYLIISFYPGDNLKSTKETAILMKKISQYGKWLIEYMRTIHLPHSLGQFATPYPGTDFYHQAKKEGIVLAKSWNDYNRQKINFLPFSFIHDKPIKKKVYSFEEFRKILIVHKELFNEYLKDPTLVTSKNIESYIEDLYKIYEKVSGEKTIEDYSNNDTKYLIKICVAFKFLAAFGFVEGKNENCI